MRKKKGLSPLIAAVILIAATMTIAGILALWVSTYVTSELEGAERAGITGGTKCLGAHFELRPESSYSNNKLYLMLDNKKSIDLTLTDLFLIESDNTVKNITLDETLKGNEIKLTTVPNVNPFLTGEIKTNCPDVSVYFTYDQVT